MEKENDIDSLARMFVDSFSSMETSMGKRFDGLEDRMENLELETHTINERMGTLEQEVRATNKRIDKVIMPELDEHALRIKNLELKLA